jgi:nitric oxide synthase oxygenase domain/subunit
MVMMPEEEREQAGRMLKGMWSWIVRNKTEETLEKTFECQ